MGDVGKVVCDIWEKWVRWAKTNDLSRKCEMWEKWGATYREKWVAVGENK